MKTPDNDHLKRIDGGVADADGDDLTIRLRESERRFRQLVEKAPLAMAIVSVDGVIEFINQKAISVFGYLPEDIPTMQRWWAQAYPDERYRNEVVAAWMGRVQHAVATDSEIAGDEYRATCKDGTVKTVFISGVYASGRVFVLFDDITERKRAEEVLRQDEERWRIAFENAPTGMVSVGPDGRFWAVNPMFCQMVGYTSEELLTGSFARITHPDDVELSNLWVRKQLSGDFSQPELEKRYVHKDGHVIWSVVRARWVRNADGSPRFSVAHVQDITQRRVAEEALRQSEMRFRLVFEHAEDCIFIAETEPGSTPVITDANPAVKRVLGYERDELIGKPITVLAVDADGAEQARRTSQTVSAGGVVAYYAKHPCKDGSIREFECMAKTFVRGSTTLAISFQRDITERQRAEDARRELQDRLYQSQKMEAIGTLAGGIAHDFNNILAGIMGGLSLLEFELGEAGSYHPDIQETKALVGRGADLAKQLLGFARGGKYDVRPLDLAHVVEKTSSMFGRTRKDITVQLDMAPGLPAILMDHTQLEQVLLNLLLNAGQAMPDGGRVLLHAENVNYGIESEEVKFGGAPPGRFVRLVVADTGIGMDAATQARIFEPFFTTKEVGQGTGLGLASVYGIVKGHGGSISVESRQGEGATFTLLLPATDRSPVGEKASLATVQQGRGTILVVDDEEQILRPCARMLERIGFDVLTASGGKQAIEIFRQHGERISLVILDMTMPDMSGSQTFDRLRAIAPGAKVLLCSGYSIEGQAQNILARGCNGFIQKPFDIAALSAKLAEIL